MGCRCSCLETNPSASRLRRCGSCDGASLRHQPARQRPSGESRWWLRPSLAVSRYPRGEAGPAPARTELPVHHLAASSPRRPAAAFSRLGLPCGVGRISWPCGGLLPTEVRVVLCLDPPCSEGHTPRLEPVQTHSLSGSTRRGLLCGALLGRLRSSSGGNEQRGR